MRYPVYSYSFRVDKGRTPVRNNFIKTKFCSFVVGNYLSAMKESADFFNLLSKYKKVDSGGTVFNNIGEVIPPGWEAKVKFLEPYKFNIAFENSVYEGYTTEKILDAFYAGCIPIYYGDPLIGEVFNEKAFINCHKFKSFDDVVKKVIEIDNNEELRLAMLKEPIFNKEIDDKLEEFLYNIFDQDIKSAYRRRKIQVPLIVENSTFPQGKCTKAENTSFLHKVARKIKRIVKRIFC